MDGIEAALARVETEVKAAREESRRERKQLDKRLGSIEEKLGALGYIESEIAMHRRDLARHDQQIQTAQGEIGALARDIAVQENRIKTWGSIAGVFQIAISGITIGLSRLLDK